MENMRDEVDEEIKASVGNKAEREEQFLDKYELRRRLDHVWTRCRWWFFRILKSEESGPRGSSLAFGQRANKRQMVIPNVRSQPRWRPPYPPVISRLSHLLRGAIFVCVSLINGVFLLAMHAYPSTGLSVPINALLVVLPFALAAALWDRRAAYFLSIGAVMAALYVVLRIFTGIQFPVFLLSY